MEVLKAALLKYDPYFNITSYSNEEVLIEDLMDNNKIFDLIFLDIYMPRINGIDIAKKIYSHSRNSKIIFVSSSDKYYSEAFNVFAFNYILKPIDPIRLKDILDQALINIEEDRKNQINIFSKGYNYMIYLKDILYVESSDKKVTYHLANRNSLECYNKLDDIYKLLPEEHFIRCHQSYIVNLIHVTKLSNDYFYIGDQKIKISKKYSKASKDKYLFYSTNRGKQ